MYSQGSTYEVEVGISERSGGSVPKRCQRALMCSVLVEKLRLVPLVHCAVTTTGDGSVKGASAHPRAQVGSVSALGSRASGALRALLASTRSRSIRVTMRLTTPLSVEEVDTAVMYYLQFDLTQIVGNHPPALDQAAGSNRVGSRLWPTVFGGLTWILLVGRPGLDPGTLGSIERFKSSRPLH